MTDHPNDKLRRASYEIGYGKPPVAGQFVRGKSGNPLGRPKKATSKKSVSKPRIDPSTRDLVLSAAGRPVKVRDGDSVLEIPVREAVIRAESVAAMKGNPQAQKNFLEREARYRDDLNAEINEDREFWQEYSATYEQVISQMKKSGLAPPAHWPHLDDIVFEEGQRVMFAGGDPEKAAKTREYIIRMRDIFILQAEKDRRHRGATGKRLESTPILVSEVLVQMLNASLPKRMQLEPLELILRIDCNRALTLRMLNQRLRNEWADVGIPEARNLITPAVTAEALSTLRRS